MDEKVLIPREKLVSDLKTTLDNFYSQFLENEKEGEKKLRTKIEKLEEKIGEQEETIGRLENFRDAFFTARETLGDLLESPDPVSSKVLLRRLFSEMRKFDPDDLLVTQLFDGVSIAHRL